MLPWPGTSVVRCCNDMLGLHARPAAHGWALELENCTRERASGSHKKRARAWLLQLRLDGG